ncbi:MAG TPA: hypothetical protein VFP54_03890 [Acidimicrobiales bacterium]|nr:hypothetical protein [Acidimicrobiales bacterium]
MPSTPRRDRRGRLLAGAVFVAALAGCGGPHRHSAASTTTLLHADRWTAPVVTGPPSAAGFCTVLVAMFSHQSELPVATTPVKKRILADFVATVPEALRNAPPDIAPAARIYLDRLAAVLTALSAANFDYGKVPAGTLAPLLLDPEVKAAGNRVLAYSSTVCHYTIGAAPTQP